ncbi:MAG: hypothetical protein JXR37_15865 [Kiritimatiellae bacterium]|nr:hypothetical protein [Kiritimatiellia bacterium]
MTAPAHHTVRAPLRTAWARFAELEREQDARAQTLRALRHDVDSLLRTSFTNSINRVRLSLQPRRVRIRRRPRMRRVIRLARRDS